MFFIFGMPRSGTTLLAQCLNANPEIVVPHETDFIIPMTFIIDRINDEEIGRKLIYKLVVNSVAYPSSLGEYVDAQTVYDVLHSCEYHASRILEALYAKVAEAAKARLAGDKSPNDLNFLRMLVKTGGLAPDTKIIHIIRDIRDVMISVNETGWVSGLDAYFPRFWCGSNMYLNSLYKFNPNYILVKYEDLAFHPEDEVAKLCHFLDVEFQQDMLMPENRSQRYRGTRAHSNLYNPISSCSVGKYKTMLEESSRQNYEMQAGEALEAFGYM